MFNNIYLNILKTFFSLIGLVSFPRCKVLINPLYCFWWIKASFDVFYHISLAITLSNKKHHKTLKRISLLKPFLFIPFFKIIQKYFCLKLFQFQKLFCTLSIKLSITCAYITYHTYQSDEYTARIFRYRNIQ